MAYGDTKNVVGVNEPEATRVHAGRRIVAEDDQHAGGHRNARDRTTSRGCHVASYGRHSLRPPTGSTKTGSMPPLRWVGDDDDLPASNSSSVAPPNQDTVARVERRQHADSVDRHDHVAASDNRTENDKTKATQC